MSAAGHLDMRHSAAASWLRRIEATVRGSTATLLRPPRGPVAWRSRQHWVAVALLAAAATVATMALFDAWAANYARSLPAELIAAARRLTDLGKSGWFLWPTGVVLLTLTVFENPVSTRISRGILAAFAVRLGFVFLAIALPGLFVTIVKRLIGRARPFVAGNDVWAYDPFSWQVRYASFPSGHVTTAFAALFAIGALFPQARALMWIYAVMIAASRVLVTAHYPSDVIAGAFVGVVGALLVRNWFAARRLGFAVGSDGSVRPMPGPSVWRIIKAVARRPHSA
jgi:membrane-associated phospholipid phosphatase